ncbi:MAG: SUMF1/EgtB/PvdO family nonheme iron enzyme [Planctomycetes bacterium]|nr:SUMF1/EgtB/PvdO family nonheme iron enzyme [Planctomycetota bacterium]
MAEGGVGQYAGPVAMLILGGLVGTFLLLHTGTFSKGPAKTGAEGGTENRGVTREDIARIEKTQREIEAGKLVAEGDTAMSKGDHDTALKRYRRALELDPTHPRAEEGAKKASLEEEYAQLFAAGQEFLTAGKLEDAKSALEKARRTKETPEVLAKLKEADQGLFLRDGEELERKRDWNGALGVYEKARALAASEAVDRAISRVQTALQVERADASRKQFRTFLDAAEALERDGKLAEAIGTFRQALPFANTPAEVNARIEICERKLKDVEKLYTSSLERADKAIESGKIGEAQAYLEKALSYRPNDPVALKKVSELRDRASVQDMVLVPSGELVVPPSAGDGGGAGKKVLVRAFYVDRKEVTNQQYKAFLDANPAQAAPRGWGSNRQFTRGTENFPVMGVNAEEAAAFARWAGKRLLTEEEWEFAARGTEARAFPWGNDFDRDKCNTLEAAKGGPLPAGSYPDVAGPFGLLDMAGNVAEWTSSAEMVEQQGPGGELRSVKYGVLRGGSFLLPAAQARTGVRMLENPKVRLPGNGFRCAKDALPK